MLRTTRLVAGFAVAALVAIAAVERGGAFAEAPDDVSRAAVRAADKVSAEPLRLAEPGHPKREANIRLGRGGTITAIRAGVPSTDVTAGGTPPPVFPHPRPRLAGFSPRIIVSTSDRRKPVFDDDFEHELRFSYFGNPLNPPADQNYAVGVLDTGSGVDIVAGSAAATLGVTGQYVTQNAIPLGGIGGGTVNSYVTWPIGFFVSSFSAVQSNGTLDLSSAVGHTSVSGLAAPAIFCEGAEIVSALIGTNMIAFYNTVIRVDSPQTILYNGEEITSPDVTVQDIFDPLPDHPRFIPMNMGPEIVTTASYYPNFFDPESDGSPFFPTQLSFAAGFLPLGAWFFSTIHLRDGAPSPDNVAQPFELLVDTGAQSSIISQGVAASLNLPLQPDFTVDICGVGGVVEDVPGYYIDYARLNAAGGALEFSRAPFVVLDLASPAGGPLDGILGMNFFWNRNITLEPNIAGSSFITVSDPVEFAGGDFDLDMDVDDEDMAALAPCTSGPATTTVLADCDHVDVDLDLDIDLVDYAWLQRCYSGHGQPADTTCGP